MDPWRTSIAERHSTNIAMTFEDDFEPRNSLPDSIEYLASLEHKLAALKQQKSKKSLVHSLSEKHRSCMEQLLLGTEVNHEDHCLPEERRANALLRCMAPERQAISLDELVELLKADLLAQTVEESSSTK